MLDYGIPRREYSKYFIGILLKVYKKNERSGKITLETRAREGRQKSIFKEIFCLFPLATHFPNKLLICMLSLRPSGAFCLLLDKKWKKSK